MTGKFAPIAGATSVDIPDLYRVICPDGYVTEDVDTLFAAVSVVQNADVMHDGARCTGHHRLLVADWREIDLDA